MLHNILQFDVICCFTNSSLTHLFIYLLKYVLACLLGVSFKLSVKRDSKDGFGCALLSISIWL